MNELIIIKEFERRVFEESYSRIEICLDKLNEDEIWWKPNKNSNSIANLILHLLGNMEQWIMTSFGEEKDDRQRSLEFSKHKSHDKKALKKEMKSLQEKVLTVINKIEASDLNKEYKVQVYKEKGMSILVHVIEHFSYHTGQIALLTKLIADKDLEFYPYSLE